MRSTLRVHRSCIHRNAKFISFIVTFIKCHVQFGRSCHCGCGVLWTMQSAHPAKLNFILKWLLIIGGVAGKSTWKVLLSCVGYGKPNLLLSCIKYYDVGWSCLIMKSVLRSHCTTVCGGNLASEPKATKFNEFSAHLLRPQAQPLSSMKYCFISLESGSIGLNVGHIGWAKPATTCIQIEFENEDAKR